jgi:Protein of unknown function (DUF1194)
MSRPTSIRLAVAALLLSLAFGPVRAGPTEVDLALVLAVDISNSMDPDEQALQREGFVEAFRSPVVMTRSAGAPSARSLSPTWNGPAS